MEISAEVAWRAGDAATKKPARALTDSAQPVTAVFAAGHLLALDAMNIARVAGLSVPNDVSVVGFDDPPAAELVHPALTTIRQPLLEMGCRAINRLLEIMAGRDAVDAADAAFREILPAQLVVRRSSALVNPARST